jgi:hypothetical protein
MNCIRFQWHELTTSKGSEHTPIYCVLFGIQEPEICPPQHSVHHAGLTSEQEETAMDGNIKVKWGWLKFMYIYTIFGAGSVGLGIIVMPDVMRLIFGLPNSDQISALGITGSVYLAFALLSILGLRSPLKFSPILLLQLAYKSIWFIGVVIPLLLMGKYPAYAILITLIYVSYIIGDLIAIPFSYVFAKHSN